MENASKALIIAGGILIAIIILTMFIMMFNRMTSIQKTQEEKTKMEQLAAFNAEYEAYNKSQMYGADVITLKNKVNENNINNPSNQIILSLPEEFDELEQDELLKRRFKCTKMEYDASGRVSKITIEPV